MKVIGDTLSSEHIYIFLRDDKGRYRLKLSNAEIFGDYLISSEAGFVHLLSNANGHMLMKDYIGTACYENLSEEEKQRLTVSQIECFVGISDGPDYVGIILMSAKSNGRHYTERYQLPLINQFCSFHRYQKLSSIRSGL